MDNLLCDELLQEIFQRLSPSMSSAVSLVCKRWLFLHRTTQTSLSVRLFSHNNEDFSIPSFSSFLSRYPHLSSLTVISEHDSTSLPSTQANPEVSDHSHVFSNHLLLSVASNCFNLRHLRFLPGPVSPSALVSLSTSCERLTSLAISSFKPLSFHWLTYFPSLKELSILDCAGKSKDPLIREFDSGVDDDELGSPLLSFPSSELPLETLCLSGIGVGDCGMGWLWRSCTKLRKLRLRSCESIGDSSSFTSFVKCLQGLQELELRTCRSIADGVLLRLAEHGGSLHSLLLYDGGSREGLHLFINRCRSTLQRLDLRLPLDLDNDHLFAIAANFRSLVSLQLQSCCLVTGEGLKALGSAISGLEELTLINCDVVERESGLLTTLGQSLRGLQKLDLSYNEMLLDKEFVSMLVSCTNLVDIKLRGCRMLTNATVISMYKSCKLLVSVDLSQCCRIDTEAVEFFVLNCPRLRQVHVEKSKLSDAAKTWASQKFIEVIG